MRTEFEKSCADKARLLGEKIGFDVLRFCILGQTEKELKQNNGVQLAFNLHDVFYRGDNHRQYLKRFTDCMNKHGLSFIQSKIGKGKYEEMLCIISLQTLGGI